MNVAAVSITLAGLVLTALVAAFWLQSKGWKKQAIKERSEKRSVQNALQRVKELDRAQNQTDDEAWSTFKNNLNRGENID